MKDEPTDGSTRRTFTKRALVGGAAAIGLVGAGGSATAQPQNLNVDADTLVTSNDLLTVTIGNVDVLRNSLNNLDLVVTVENVLNDLNVEITDVQVLSDNVVAVDVSNVLNNTDVDVTALNNVDVSVSVLSGPNLDGTDTVQVLDPVTG